MKRLSFVAVVLAVGVVLSASGQPASPTGEQLWRAYFQTNNTMATLEALQARIRENPDDDIAHAALAYIGRHRSTEVDRLDSFLAAIDASLYKPEAPLFVMESLLLIDTRDKARQMLDEVNGWLESGMGTPQMKERLVFAKALLQRRVGDFDASHETFASMGFLSQFMMIGPFDNAEKRGHDLEYGPEETLDLSIAHPGRNRDVSWRAFPVAPTQGFLNLHPVTAPSRESTVYLVTVVESSRAQRVELALGHAGAIKAWINGELVADMNRYHSAKPDQVLSNVALDEGDNVLLLKVSSGEAGAYGVYARFLKEAPDSVSTRFPTTDDDLSAGIPRLEQSIDSDTFLYEAVEIRQMKALGEASTADPFHHFLYARMLQVLDVMDENDQSVTSLITQLNQIHPANPMLLTELANAESQENRKRLALERVLELDPSDTAAFIGLLESDPSTAYARRGLERIERWSERNPLPDELTFLQARLIRQQGLPRMAAAMLGEWDDVSHPRQVLFMLDCVGDTLTTTNRKQLYEQALEEDPSFMEAVHGLRRIALEQADWDAHQTWLDRERVLDPYSIVGLLELARYYQAGFEYEASKEPLRDILELSYNNAEANRLLAIAQKATGDTEGAMASLTRSLEANPSDPWSLEYMQFLQPEDETYASPYLRDWEDIDVPDSLDLSRANAVVLLHQEIVKVHPNGNSNRTVKRVIRLLTDAGVSRNQLQRVFYAEGREDVIVKRARVWKPDGSYLDAPPVDKRSASSAGDAAATMYMDYSMATSQFPALEKGAVIEWEYEKISTVENIYADYFGDQFFVGDPSYEPTVETEYVLITPKQRNFHWEYTPPSYPETVDAVEIDPTPRIVESGSERVYHWTFASLPALPREPMMPPASEIMPYIIVSTFETWGELTAWYWQLIREQLEPGPILQERLVSVVDAYKQRNGMGPEDELSTWDKVRAVNQYVNTGIRYLALSFGIHGYKPYKVDDICTAQYGDCKDKAALAIAMLGELGVEARFVVLRTSDRGDINTSLPNMGLFNHAIYYLPDIEGRDYWVDGTATFFDATELPPGDAGAHSWIVGRDGEYSFKRVRHSEADDNGGVYTTVLNLDETGQATGYRSASYRGLYNPIIRRTYENPQKAKDMVDQILSSQYPGAFSSELKLSDLEDYSTSESLSYQMTLPGLASPRGNEWVIPSALFTDDLSARYAQLSSRVYDLVLSYPWTRTNIQRVTLPEGWDVSVLPSEQNIETAFGMYSRTITRDGREVVIQEELVFTPIRVAQEDYADFREFCRQVDQYQQEPLVVREEG